MSGCVSPRSAGTPKIIGRHPSIICTGVKKKKTNHSFPKMYLPTSASFSLHVCSKRHYYYYLCNSFSIVSGAPMRHLYATRIFYIFSVHLYFCMVYQIKCILPARSSSKTVVVIHVVDTVYSRSITISNLYLLVTRVQISVQNVTRLNIGWGDISQGLGFF